MDSTNYLGEGQSTNGAHSRMQDTALVGWDKWRQKRIRIQQNLSKATSRYPICLLMNATSTSRDPYEGFDKRLVEEASSLKIVRDSWRGHPNFWETVKKEKSDETPKHIESILYPPNFSVHPRPEDLIYSKGYWGVPRAIALHDLKLARNDLCTRKPWNKSNYLASRMDELKEEIGLLEPFRPDLENLYVKGRAIPREDEVPAKSPFDENEVPAITVDECKSDSNLSEKYEVEFYLDGCRIALHESDKTHDHKLYFRSDAIGKHILKQIFFENRGSVAIKYSWERELRSTPYDIPILRPYARFLSFLFDSSAGVLLPGQSFVLDFTFVSPSRDLRKEIWRLSLEPAHKVIIVQLEGLVTGPPKAESQQITSEQVDEFMDRQLDNKMFREIMSSLERQIFTSQEHAPYASLFGENELFEFNNPTMNYRTGEVHELAELYSKYAEDGTRWNLSTIQLRNTILESSKISCSERNEALKTLNKIAHDLSHPPGEERMEKMKHRMAFTALSSFFNAMGIWADRLQTAFKMKSPLPGNILYPPLEFDDRLERYMINHVRTEPTGTMSEAAFKKKKAGGRPSTGGKRGSVKRQSTGGKRGSVKRKSTGGKRQSTGGKRQSTGGKRQSTGGKRQSTGGKRQSTGGKRQSTGGKRQSTGGKRQSTGGKRQSTGGKRQSTGGKRQSLKRKSVGGKGKGGRGSKAKPPRSKSPLRSEYIWLTDPPTPKPPRPDWQPELNRQLYTSLLEAYTRDLLADTIDKICRIVDTTNAIEAGKPFEMRVDPVAYREKFPKNPFKASPQPPPLPK